MLREPEVIIEEPPGDPPVCLNVEGVKERSPWICWWEEIGGRSRRICGQAPKDKWKCYTKDGKQICENEDLPGKGDWTCHEEGEGLVCEGTPSGPIDKSWECTKDEYGNTVCRREKISIPSRPYDRSWKCKTDEFGTTTCVAEGKRDRDLCIPGQERWCDAPDFGLWGRQLCRPDGTFANPGDPDYNDPKSPYRCKEDLKARPNNKCRCIAIFDEACCEDQEDRDGNGHPDCLIPADYKNPDCEITGKLCSYCTKNKDCGGPKDLCIYNVYTLSFYCGRDCTNKACPTGYVCCKVKDPESNAVVKQCIPASGSCQNY
jgi:hypothetical protein